jgi:ParB/RepB/Spo0J family partition protein
MPNRTAVLIGGGGSGGRDTASQPGFLPEERYEPRIMSIQLATVTGNTLEPEAGFVENIRRIGLLNPITVRHTGNGHYKLAAGRRRVAAMRQIHGTEGMVLANVFPRGTPMSLIHAMSISENTQRRPNPLTDLRAIEALVAAGANEQQIASELHLPIGTIRSRMRLAALIPSLREAIESNRMSPSTGERAARLNAGQQGQLAALLDVSPTARVTMDDVGRLLRVRATEQVEALPDAAFTPQTEAAAPQAVTGVLEQLQAVVPGWAGVLQCLTLAEQMMPTATNADTESAAAWLTDLAGLVNDIIRAGTP